MLVFFAVEGYKNFEKRVVLDLSDVRDYKFNTNTISRSIVKNGLVYGKNTSGKTNLGRAIMDIKENLASRDFILHFQDEGSVDYLNADSGTDVARFEYRFVFADSEIHYQYEKTSGFNLVRERLEVDDRLVFDFNHKDETMIEVDLDEFGGETLNWDYADASGSILSYLCNNAAASQLGVLREMYLFIRSMAMLSTATSVSFPSSTRRLAAQVIDEDLVEELEGFLHRFGIHENLVVKETPDGDKALYFKHKERLIPFARNCSSGTAALLRLFELSHRAYPVPAFLFIDEFDAFYHYELAENVISYLKNEVQSQVFCSTHNTDLFSNKIMRPDCLFILSRFGICSAANATKRELREGHNLEKLYKAGEFDV